MTVNLNIPFETLIELVDQLPTSQQQDLLRHLQTRTQGQELTVDEKMERLRAAQIDVSINREPSPRREDWYDDDGR